MKRRRFRMVLPLLAAWGLLFQPFAVCAGPSRSREMTEREKRNARLSMEAAAEGMVLLENRDQALPIKKSGKIALFGGGAVRTATCGTGSGDVNQRYSVSVWDGFKEAGYEITSGDWLNGYSEAYDKARAEYTGSWFGEVSFPEPEVTKKDVGKAREGGVDTAVYVISRVSGEGQDRSAKEGDYELSKTEEKNLKRIADEFEKVIVVLNVGGVMDTGFFQEIEGLDALVLMSQAGMESGNALVKLLNGEKTPSGKLTDTWPEAYEDYPNAAGFGANDGNVEQEDYTEGIWVGYRYFDTFGIEPAYEFGYGGSYTDFEISVQSVTADAEKVTVEVAVKNVGDTYSGKEVVQVYFSAPDGELPKPYQELAAFEKTKELSPGEEENVTLSFSTREMSSYSEERSAYLLEKGDYKIRVGNSSRNTRVEAVLTLDETVVTEQLSQQLTPDKEPEELSSSMAVPFRTEGEEEEIAKAEKITLRAEEIRREDNRSPYEDETVTTYVSDTTETEYLMKNREEELQNPYHGSYKEEVVYFEGDYSGCQLQDVYEGKITMEQFVSGLTVAEMADLVIGGNKLPTASGQAKGADSENTDSISYSTLKKAQNLSVEGAAGETAGIYIETKGIPGIVLGDGPAGLRLTREYESEDGGEYYQFCTAWPIQTLLAQTWDEDLVEKVGQAFGEEMKEYGVTILLAPGMNIHRNALCGRNFEYCSEDPYLTGRIGIAETKGVQSNPGVGTCIKHFAANNQESNRTQVNNTIGERAFREIYLKAFEMTVKEAQPMAIMSSYNQNNGIPAADDYDLLTDVARGEWGFEGIVLTDWGGGMSTPSLSMHAGNDLIMPGSSVEDITIRAFFDQEPSFGEDGAYPDVTVTESFSGTETKTQWGEFIPDPEGDVEITRTVKKEVYENASREWADGKGEIVEKKVSELLKDLKDAATVTDRGDGNVEILYRGRYEENNIALGDLQKSVIHLLNVVMRSSQFLGE